MNKKFLSAILFGALMVTATGTFVSCKDYDDDIDRINKELTDIKSQIAALQTAVDNGKWITSVEPTANGLTITMNDGKTYPVTNGKDGAQGEKGEAGDKVLIDATTGAITINGEATGFFATKNTETGKFAVPEIGEDGFWYVVNEEGKLEATSYKASPVSAVQDPNTKAWTLKVWNTETKVYDEIKLPSAANSITSLSLAGNATAVTSLNFPMSFQGDDTKQMVNLAGTKWAKKAIVSPYNEDGTKGAFVDVVITPANVDVADLTFNLQNSKGATVWADGVIAETPTLKARAASTGVYRIYFAYKDGLTKDGLTGDNKILAADDALAVVCGNASTSYALSSTFTGTFTNTTVNVNAAATTWVKLGEKYDIFGKGFSSDPSKTGANAQAFLANATGMTDLKLSIDAERASLYGITIEGTSFTISGDAYEATIPFTLTYTSSATTDKNNAVSKTVNVKVQSKAIASAVTLKASHALSIDEANGKVYAYIPLADLASAITGADKIAWNEASALTLKTIKNNAVGTNLALTSSKKYDGNNLIITEGTEIAYTSTAITSGMTLVKANKKDAASKLVEAAYLRISVNPKNANVTADTYSALVQFEFASNKKAQATVELTFTNPAVLQRIPSLFDGDNVVAYGTGNNGNGEVFNVLSVYNTVGITFGSNPTATVKAVSGKTNWGIGSYDTANKKFNITIPSKEQMYTDTREVTVSYEIFAGATNNKFEDVIYVTGKSPIKEGTIEALKTTLELGQSKSATFVNSDFSAKDVWGTAYNLFGYSYADGKDQSGNTKYSWANPATDYISAVSVSANTSLVKVEPTYKADNKSYAEMTGFKVTVDNEAALQSGDKVKVTIKITDKWGMEFTKEVELTVTK